MEAPGARLAQRAALSRGHLMWLAIAVAAVAIGVLAALAPVQALALALLVLLLGLVGWGFVRQDVLGVCTWVCFGYSGFALGGLYYALSPGERVPFVAIPVYASLLSNRTFLILALGVTIVGLLSYLAGYASKSPACTDIPRHSLVTPEVPVHRLAHVVVIMSLVGLASTYAYYQSAGGFRYLLSHIYGRTTFRSTAYLQWGALILPAANLLWFAHDYRRALHAPVYWLHMICCSLLLVSFGDRWGVVGFWLMLVTLDYYLSGRRFRTRTMLVLGALGATAALAIGIWRGLSSGEFAASGINLGRVQEVILFELGRVFGTRNLTDIDVLSWTIGRGYEQIGGLGGSSLVQVILAPIPRAIFPQKPVELGETVFAAYTRSEFRSSWHPTFVGELFLNFWYPGVIVGMFLLGRLSSWIERQRQRRSQPLALVLYAVFTAKFVMLLVTVDFYMALLQALFYALPAIAAGTYLSRQEVAQS